MMGYSDTGLCVPETVATLALQQSQLVNGKRDVQMFPLGTSELPLPHNLARHRNARGVFHFRADKISVNTIDTLSSQGRENEFLNLGPIGKPEVAERALAGETLLCVTEYTPAGIELRCAAGTDKTVDAQREYFELTKEPDNSIVVSDLPRVINARRAGVV